MRSSSTRSITSWVRSIRLRTASSTTGTRVVQRPPWPARRRRPDLPTALGHREQLRLRPVAARKQRRAEDEIDERSSKLDTGRDDGDAQSGDSCRDVEPDVECQRSPPDPEHDNRVVSKGNRPRRPRSRFAATISNLGDRASVDHDCHFWSELLDIHHDLSHPGMDAESLAPFGFGWLGRQPITRSRGGAR